MNGPVDGSGVPPQDTPDAPVLCSNIMAGRRGLVLGVANDHSIAWGIARTLSQHGADIAFTYQNDAIAKRVTPLAASLGSTLVLPCEVEDQASIDSVFQRLKAEWGGLDFVVHAVAYSDRKSVV